MPLLPAARKTDDTSHSSGSEITGPCDAHMEIEGLPAARVTDMTTCTQILHVENPIVWGSETMTIGGLFAARKTDQSLCASEITTGAANVLIGGPTLKFKAHPGWLPGSRSGNSLVAISTETKNIYVLSFLEYSGPNASAAYAANAEAQIEAMWGGRKTTIDGQEYTVNVDVRTTVRGDGDPATSGYDQIIVDDTTTRSNQSLYGSGDGHQTSKDANPGNYVAAHEYGHSLGLGDEYHDEYVWQAGWPPIKNNGSVPNDPSKVNNIMSQTWPSDGVDPHPYDDQYNQILENYGLK